MKNRITLLIIAITLFAAVPSHAAFNLKNNTSKNLSKADKEILATNNTRLAELKILKVNAGSKIEKKAIRKEVKDIKKKSAAISGGIYISAGALILILILLIILL
jgi:long-subunit fatty acid transport protein